MAPGIWVPATGQVCVAQKFDWSVGVFYDLGLAAFRAIFRLGILQLWSAPLTAFRGSAQVSTVVTLESR